MRDKTKKRIKLSGRYQTILFVAALFLIAITVVSAVLLNKVEEERIESEGQTRLSNIAQKVDNSLYCAECLLDSVVLQVEQILKTQENPTDRLKEFFDEELIETMQEDTQGSCFNVYAAYDGVLIIHDFVPDESFVLEKRAWYLDARKLMGKLNVTEPYIDADTGEMCFSVSKVLSDGATVVCMDFNLNEVQQYIEEMNEGGTEISLIVNEDGMIVGHTDSDYVGTNYKETDFFYELVNKVFVLYGDSFTFKKDGVTYNVFSDKTSCDWFLVVCVKQGTTSLFQGKSSLYVTCFMLVFSMITLAFLYVACRMNARAEHAMKTQKEFLTGTDEKLRSHISKIMNRANILSSVSMQETETEEAAQAIRTLTQSLNRTLDECMKEGEDKKQGGEYVKKGQGKENKSFFRYRLQIFFVIFILMGTGIFAYLYNTATQNKLSSLKIESESQSYINQVREWALTNKTVLDVIADSVSAQPGMEEDYEYTLTYLDNIVSNYDDISVAYLTNPQWEETVIMNNGWKPDKDWHVEERQWYIDTLMSSDSFNVSTPYQDEQTGLYCTTFSKIIYDESGNFRCILGIDFYLDKLVEILGESYTDSGYAFLTDIDGNIINHPYDEYQMKYDRSVNVAELCYREALSLMNEEAVQLTDYDNEKKVALAAGEDITGFNVVVVKSAGEILGNVTYSNWIYIGVFACCIIIVSLVVYNIAQWQKHVNEELKEAAQKAISAGQAKDSFLANMSHEIRTPINAVLGMNEMIMRESGEPPIREYAASIQSAGRTLLSLINDILDFSKIESGKMEIVPVEYDVATMINDIVNMVRVRAEKKKLRFIPEIDEKIPSRLYGDDVRLRQVMTNILTNAVKYTAEGYIRLTMKVLQIQDGVVTLEVSVTDTGMGIKDEDMGRLCASFQRLDQQKNRSIEGTGLGLSIVSQLLQLMGSELNVSSVYGVGSVFSFVIEQRIVHMAAIGDYERMYSLSTREKEHLSAKTAPQARVLVVDDNDTNLLVAKNLLKRTQVKVQTASSGRECLELLRRNLYDIVFLDHMMPEMDGIETLQKIREEQLAEGTVFVALTANAIHGAKQTYMDSGFDDYLSKPFTGSDIEKCLFEHISDGLIKRNRENTETAQAQEKMLLSFKAEVEAAISSMEGGVDAYRGLVSEFCDNNRCSDLEMYYSLKDNGGYKLCLEKVARDCELLGLGQLLAGARGLLVALEKKDEAYVKKKHRVFLGMYREAVEHIEAEVLNYLS